MKKVWLVAVSAVLFGIGLQAAEPSKCPRDILNGYAKEIKDGGLDMVLALKETYKKAMSKQGEQCRSLLVADFYAHYREMMVRYGESVNVASGSPEAQKLSVQLARVGWKLYSNEGMAYVAQDATWMLREFEGLISEGWQVYLVQKAKEVNEGFTDDAALMISWEQLMQRVVFWEQFLAKYPDFEPKDESRELLNIYLNAFIEGTDNSPIYDWNSRKVIDEAKRAYEQFIANNTASKYHVLIQSHYAILKDAGFVVDKPTQAKLKANLAKQMPQ